MRYFTDSPYERMMMQPPKSGRGRGSNRRKEKQMRLIICEKPSVGKSVAKVLGVTEKKDGYLEGQDYIVSWCVGHLVGPAAADSYDERYSRWDRKDLPILPDPWKFQVAPATKKQYEVLKTLMERSDISEIINGCDAGREGELIFRLVYDKVGCKKPFKRLWISSMEDAAIRKGFDELREGEEFDNLYAAALCRLKADWLVGINDTRLFTILNGSGTMNVGRVMTPTLDFLVERSEKIAAFQSEKYYVIEMEGAGFRAESGRFESKTEAERFRKACLGCEVSVTSVKREERKKKAPKLYDLTTLQREGNRIYGYTAQQTLDYLQSLYEKKLATYPRTDSRYLTEDMAQSLPSLCDRTAEAFPFGQSFSGIIDTSQVIDNAKVTDHHALLPTVEVSGEKLKELPTGERNILSLIAQRLLCALCPEDHVYEDTLAEFQCRDVVFTAKGHTEVSAGWMAVERAFRRNLKEKPKEEEAEAVLPELREGQCIQAKDFTLREGKTSPPKAYTEDSLLSAMERASAEEFAQIGETEHRGLGTPATRAGIIEKLVKGGFAERNKRQIVPTKKGISLIKELPEQVKSAAMTAEWESALQAVEQGKMTAEEFLSGIVEMVSALVRSYEGVPDKEKGDREEIGKCPRCGKPVYEGKKNFYCSGYQDDPPCDFALWKDTPYFKAKRKELTKKVAAALLKDGRVKMTGLYSEKKGDTYDATIVMEDTGGKYVNFKLEFPSGKGGKKAG